MTVSDLDDPTQRGRIEDLDDPEREEPSANRSGPASARRRADAQPPSKPLSSPFNEWSEPPPLRGRSAQNSSGHAARTDWGAAEATAEWGRASPEPPGHGPGTSARPEPVARRQADQRPLGDALVRMGLLTAQQLESMLATQRREGRPLSKQLVTQGFLTEDRLVQVLGEQLGIETIDLSEVWVHERVRNLVLVSVARRMLVLPIARRRVGTHDALLLAMVDPLDDEAVAVVARRLPDDMRVVRLLAGEEELSRAIGRVYGADEAGDDAETRDAPPIDDLRLPTPPAYAAGQLPGFADLMGPEPTLEETDAQRPAEPSAESPDPFGDPPTIPTESDGQDTQAAVPIAGASSHRQIGAYGGRSFAGEAAGTAISVAARRHVTESGRSDEPATQPVGVDDFSAVFPPERDGKTAIIPAPIADDEADDPPAMVTPVVPTPSGGVRMPGLRSGGVGLYTRAPATEVVRARGVPATDRAGGSNGDALGRVPHDALGRVPHDDALGRGPHDDALGRLPHDDALGRVPHDDALGRVPHDDALGRTRVGPRSAPEVPVVPPEDAPALRDTAPTDGRRWGRDVTRRVGPPVDSRESDGESEVLVKAVVPRIPLALLLIAAASLVAIVGVGAWVLSKPPTIRANLPLPSVTDEGELATGPNPPLAPIRPARPSTEIVPGVVDGPPPPGHSFVLSDGLELRATAAEGAEPLLWLKAGQIVQVVKPYGDSQLVVVPPEGPAGFVRGEMLGDRLPLSALARKLKFKACVVSDDGRVDDCLFRARTQWEDCRFRCTPGTRCESACQAAFDACLKGCRASERSR